MGDTILNTSMVSSASAVAAPTTSLLKEHKVLQSEVVRKLKHNT